jgi:hypothetical protein
VCALKEGEVKQVPISTGEHTIKMRMFCGLPTRTLRFSVTEGQTVAFRITHNPYSLWWYVILGWNPDPVVTFERVPFYTES